MVFLFIFRMLFISFFWCILFISYSHSCFSEIFVIYISSSFRSISFSLSREFQLSFHFIFPEWFYNFFLAITFVSFTCQPHPAQSHSPVASDCSSVLLVYRVLGSKSPSFISKLNLLTIHTCHSHFSSSFDIPHTFSTFFLTSHSWIRLISPFHTYFHQFFLSHAFQSFISSSFRLFNANLTYSHSLSYLHSVLLQFHSRFWSFVNASVIRNTTQISSQYRPLY